MEKAEEMGLLSVGMAAVLCYELGQRVGDARRMTRSAFEDNAIRVIQHKTDTELLLPISEILAKWIAKIPPKQHHLVVSEQTGKPYEDYELSKAAAIVRNAAGLRPELCLADLRRTCLTELGRAGASDDQLISVSGHTNRQMLRVYSRTEYEKALIAMKGRWATRDAA